MVVAALLICLNILPKTKVLIVQHLQVLVFHLAQILKMEWPHYVPLLKSILSFADHLDNNAQIYEHLS